MYLSLITVLSALCGLSYAKEFVVTSSTFQGSGVYDHDMLNTACQSIGDEYVPARIDSATENADASAACIATGSGWCWFDVVRDDVSNTEWYHLADGASVSFTSWDQGEPGSAESCVALRGEPWHDWGCNWGPLRVLCMLQPSDSCGAAGELFPIKHLCQCQPECNGEFCRAIGVVADSLKEEVDGACESTGGKCCCSCSDCDGFKAYLN